MKPQTMADIILFDKTPEVGDKIWLCDKCYLVEKVECEGDKQTMLFAAVDGDEKIMFALNSHITIKQDMENTCK